LTLKNHRQKRPAELCAKEEMRRLSREPVHQISGYRITLINHIFSFYNEVCDSIVATLDGADADSLRATIRLSYGFNRTIVRESACPWRKDGAESEYGKDRTPVVIEKEWVCVLRPGDTYRLKYRCTCPTERNRGSKLDPQKKGSKLDPQRLTIRI